MKLKLSECVCAVMVCFLHDFLHTIRLVDGIANRWLRHLVKLEHDESWHNNWTTFHRNKLLKCEDNRFFFCTKVIILQADQIYRTGMEWVSRGSGYIFKISARMRLLPLKPWWANKVIALIAVCQRQCLSLVWFWVDTHLKFPAIRLNNCEHSIIQRSHPSHIPNVNTHTQSLDSP